MGKKASEFARRLLEGKCVLLEFDVEKHDKYNRLLAYVYLNDGTFVNAKIIEEEYASPSTYPPNVRHADHFHMLISTGARREDGLMEERVF